MNPHLVFDLTAKSVALLLLASGLQSVWRGASAAQRSLVWLAAFACLSALPLTGLVEPLWTLAREVETVPLTSSPAETGEVGASSHLPARLSTVPAAPVTQAPRLSPWQMAFGVWAAGALLLIAHRWLGSWRLRGLQKDSRPCTAPGILQQVADLRGALGIRRTVEVRISSSIPVPVTWGILRPVILMPEQSVAWPDGSVAAALLHELGHIRHLDAASRLLASLCCALHWPNPLVWFADQAWRAAQERRADDLVLHAGIPAQDYAWQLLDAARAFRNQGISRAPVLAMARHATLERRLTAIMDRDRNRRQTGRQARGIATVLGLLAIAGLIAVRVQGEPIRIERGGNADAEQLIEVEVSLLKLSPTSMIETGQLLKDQKVPAKDQDALLRRLLQDQHTKISRYPRMVTKDGSEVLFRSVVTDADSKIVDGLEVAVLPRTQPGRIRIVTRVTKTVAGVKSDLTEAEDLPDGGTMLLVREGGGEVLLIKANSLPSAGKVIVAKTVADAGNSEILIRARLIESPPGKMPAGLKQGRDGGVQVLSEGEAKSFSQSLQAGLDPAAEVKLLSSPTVTTRSGQKATIEVLSDLPVPGKGPIKVGPIMSFIPRLRQGTIELSADLVYSEKTGEENGYPIVASRSIKTSVVLSKDETALFTFATTPGQTQLLCLVSAETVADGVPAPPGGSAVAGPPSAAELQSAAGKAPTPAVPANEGAKPRAGQAGSPPRRDR